MFQRWEDLLFAHWPVDADRVRERIPPPLALDTFDGSAWVGITPFRIENLRLRGLPPVPGTRSFLELNFRTYVCGGNGPGVYFFTLEAANALAVAAARAAVGLPYHWARMTLETRGAERRFTSRRRAGGYPVFEVEYFPAGEVGRSRPGTLEYFLTERYRLYTVADGTARRVEIDHAPWPLRPARASIGRNDLFSEYEIAPTAAEPTLHFAGGLDVKIWAPRPAS
jgi:uncharacterized protein YqjF (DUF2071 family)